MNLKILFIVTVIIAVANLASSESVEKVNNILARAAVKQAQYSSASQAVRSQCSCLVSNAKKLSDTVTQILTLLKKYTNNPSIGEDVQRVVVLLGVVMNQLSAVISCCSSGGVTLADIKLLLQRLNAALKALNLVLNAIVNVRTNQYVTGRFCNVVPNLKNLIKTLNLQIYAFNECIKNLCQSNAMRPVPGCNDVVQTCVTTQQQCYTCQGVLEGPNTTPSISVGDISTNTQGIVNSIVYAPKNNSITNTITNIMYGVNIGNGNTNAINSGNTAIVAVGTGGTGGQTALPNNCTGSGQNLTSSLTCLLTNLGSGLNTLTGNNNASAITNAINGLLAALGLGNPATNMTGGGMNMTGGGMNMTGGGMNMTGMGGMNMTGMNMTGGGNDTMIFEDYVIDHHRLARDAPSNEISYDQSMTVRKQCPCLVREANCLIDVILQIIDLLKKYSKSRSIGNEVQRVLTVLGVAVNQLNGIIQCCDSGFITVKDVDNLFRLLNAALKAVQTVLVCIVDSRTSYSIEGRFCDVVPNLKQLVQKLCVYIKNFNDCTANLCAPSHMQTIPSCPDVKKTCGTMSGKWPVWSKCVNEGCPRTPSASVGNINTNTQGIIGSLVYAPSGNNITNTITTIMYGVNIGSNNTNVIGSGNTNVVAIGSGALGGLGGIGGNNSNSCNGTNLAGSVNCLLSNLGGGVNNLGGANNSSSAGNALNGLLASLGLGGLTGGGQLGNSTNGLLNSLGNTLGTLSGNAGNPSTGDALAGLLASLGLGR